MAITEKECAWPECDKKFHGTERREYCGNTCKNKQWRKENKDGKASNDNLSST